MYKLLHQHSSITNYANVHSNSRVYSTGRRTRGRRFAAISSHARSYLLRVFLINEHGTYAQLSCGRPGWSQVRLLAKTKIKHPRAVGA